MIPEKGNERFREKVIVNSWCSRPGEIKPEYVIHSQESCRLYADRIAVPYENLRIPFEELPKGLSPAWSKINMLKWFVESKYNRMLYLDLDIIVNNNSPDIFRTHPTGNWLRRDSLMEMNWPYQCEQWFVNHLKDRIVCQPYYNTGVMLIDRYFAENLIGSTCPYLDDSGVYEQHVFNYIIRKDCSDVRWLSPSWNYFCFTEDDVKKKEDPATPRYFMHFLSRDNKNMIMPYVRQIKN